MHIFIKNAYIYEYVCMYIWREERETERAIVTKTKDFSFTLNAFKMMTNGQMANKNLF